jgi:hypothetical protein
MGMNHQELDAAYAEAAAFDQQQAMAQLDAYGHMNWSVGNEDWIACLDAALGPHGIVYHVVVDCESGGFIQTVEGGEVLLSEALAKLADLPWRYAQACLDACDGEDAPDTDEIEACAASWRAHLEDLIEQADGEAA